MGRATPDSAVPRADARKPVHIHVAYPGGTRGQHRRGHVQVANELQGGCRNSGISWGWVVGDHIRIKRTKDPVMNKGAVRLDGTWRVGRKKEAFVCVAPYQERHLGLRARSEQLTRIIRENPSIDDRKVMHL